MSLETSLGPRRYQAILGILRDDCCISLGDLDQYVGNAEEFKSIQFDHADYHKDDPKNTLVQFNQKAVELLNQDGGKLWKDLDKLLRSEAYKKDLKRIVEKLHPNDELKNEIGRHLLAIYSGGAIEEPFNQLKIILISQRLKAKGLEQDKALILATRFIVGKESLETLQQDESVQKMGETKPSERKLEAIFTKYAAFGKISDATQLRKRVVGKVLSQFQKKFAEQIHYLDGIQTVEMDGSEILFRGIDEKSGLTEDLIKQQFEDIHVGMSTSDGVLQQLSSYKIQQKRVPGPGGLGNRASYATATTFNFAVAAKYAGNEGWIYDVRSKKGKVATNLQKLSPTYQEIDFEAIDPEEIYAVYKVLQTSIASSNPISRTNKIEKVILNPHYKKRESDSLNLLVEGQEIVTKEKASNCGGGDFSVTSGGNNSDGVDVFKSFNEQQIEFHGSKYSMGSHLRKATSTLMQNKEVKPLVVGLDYNRSFSDIDAGSEVVEKDAAVTDQSDAASQEKSDALWVNYKKGSNSKNDLHSRGWFWGNVSNSGGENNFKVFISVEPDDLNKATEILIKNGYFNYQQLPKCLQKVPPYSEEIRKRRLAIILYAQGEKTTESDKIWAERLNAIEKDFYEAGIKPRPLVSKEEAAFLSVADDRKFPGSLYSYYKKDVFKYDQPWNWRDDNYFSGIEINVAESINQKIWAIKSKISEAEAGGNSSELPRLNDMLRAEELYLEISKVGPEGTEYIQSGTNIPDEEKTIEVKVISFDSSEETQKMTLERARYFHANDLRRCGSIETGNVDILTAPDDDITISTQTSPAITHEEALEQTLDQFKSGSVAFMRMGTKKANNNYTGYYTEEDFQNKKFSPTNQDDVVVLFGGNDLHIINPGSNGGGQAKSAGPNGNPEGKGTFAFPITTTGEDKWFEDFENSSIAKKNIEAEILVLKKAIDAGAKIVIPTDNNDLSSMPGNLSNSVFSGGANATAKSVKNMISELKRYGTERKAQDTNLSIGAVLQLRNFVTERAKYFKDDNFEQKMESYLAFIEKNNNKSLKEMTEGLSKLKITNATPPTPLRPKPNQQNHRQADEKKVAISESPIPPSTIPTSKSEKKITEEKIFEAVNSSSNAAIEKLSAEDVAIRKATAVEGSEDSTKKNLAGLLEYAAKGVLNKAIKAKNCSGSRNVNQETWDQDGGSKKAWYKRFTRTDFKTVDLSKTFRTVFVNCTFDENCILPNDSSSIDPKYFLNCEFSKVLMDKPENEALKSALENAGMELDRDSGFYKIGNVERKRYADKTKEGKPNPNFKPIESFKFVEGIEIWLKEIDR